MDVPKETESLNAKPVDTTNQEELSDSRRYSKLVGKLNYLSHPSRHCFCSQCSKPIFKLPLSGPLECCDMDPEIHQVL